MLEILLIHWCCCRFTTMYETELSFYHSCVIAHNYCELWWPRDDPYILCNWVHVSIGSLSVGMYNCFSPNHIFFSYSENSIDVQSNSTISNPGNRKRSDTTNKFWYTDFEQVSSIKSVGWNKQLEYSQSVTCTCFSLASTNFLTWKPTRHEFPATVNAMHGYINACCRPVCCGRAEEMQLSSRHLLLHCLTNKKKRWKIEQLLKYIFSSPLKVMFLCSTSFSWEYILGQQEHNVQVFTSWRRV